MSFAVLWANTKKDLLLRLRDPLTLAAWIGIPFLIGGLVSSLGGDGGKPPRGKLLICDQDGSLLSGLLVGGFGQGPLAEFFEVLKVEAEAGREQIDAGKGEALLVIPEGFGEAILKDTPAELQLVRNPAHTILPGIAEETLSMLSDVVFYLQRIAGDRVRGDLEGFIEGPPAGSDVFPNETIAAFTVEINNCVERLGKYLFPPVIELELVEPEADESESAGGVPDIGFASLFFPCVIFMSLFFMAQGISDDVWQEKNQGTLRRALASPHSAAPMLAGKLLSTAMIMAPYALGGVCLGVVALGFRWRDVPMAVLWVVPVGVTLTAFMMLVQLCATSQRAGSLLTNALLFPLLMLGGAFFPFEAMPAWMASLGRRLPNGWALERFKDILFARASAGQLGLGFALVALLATILYGACLARLRGPFGRNA
jgi:ABC-type Na+ efflux pump permease subunit